MVAITLSHVIGLLALSASPVLSAPVQHLDHDTSNALESRNPIIARVILQVGKHLIKSLIDLAFDFKDDVDAAKDEFTQGMIRQLQLEYPYKNVIVFHDQDSQFEFVNAEHGHHELEIGLLGLTKGYETYVFDSGTFNLAGDGGFINWAFAGSYDRDGSHVTFHPIPEPENVAPPPVPETPALPPMTVVRASSAKDGNYFVNCQHSDGTLSSGVAYYSDLTPGNNYGQQPDDYVDVTHGSLYNWEQIGSVVFPSTHTRVRWSIFGDSQARRAGESAGTADNGYQNFWTYKDSNNLLYEIDGWTCNSVYWAF